MLPYAVLAVAVVQIDLTHRIESWHTTLQEFFTVVMFTHSRF